MKVGPTWWGRCNGDWNTPLPCLETGGVEEYPGGQKRWRSVRASVVTVCCWVGRRHVDQRVCASKKCNGIMSQFDLFVPGL